MRDPYTILGVPRTANHSEIKKAYRKLARTRHPDLNPDDPKAEEAFKEISAAYSLLSDEQKRARFDRGEIDAEGNEKGFGGGWGPGGPRGPQGSSRTWQRSANPGGPGRPGDFRFDSIFGDLDEDLFSDLFSGGGRGGARRASAPKPERGGDTHYRLRISFEEAALGATRRITLTNRKTLDIQIPPGWEDGAQLRLKGQGTPGIAGGASGDALVEVKIKPHPVFVRDGFDVVANIPVTLKEILLGAKIVVPTLEGKASVTIPEDSNTETVLRLRGKGIPHGEARGDLLIRLVIILPEPPDETLKACVKNMPDPEEDPRTKAGIA
ncbi:J domain-containing protein [Phaeovibrio sulfidiphilus]|uniref:J domain-containing protein n=1 Tax=Phaeovibrio sulfidiphilus TaxID=1220600 RepID=A0A8J6YNX8_9PROT|nr:J domain-containing protein [Phaeovibrio sulfidiphilus]MBE1237269.1 J domain-containing protein [Phaeovibrio sulfidiphilus]